MSVDKPIKDDVSVVKDFLNFAAFAVESTQGADESVVIQIGREITDMERGSALPDN